MPDVEWSKLPTGSMGWRSLIEWAVETDDRLERYFLELKSDLDLNIKRDRHKVAKFILGAAHRDSIRAAKRFGGHALLIAGVSKGTIAGIRGFEAKDLERDVQKFAGADGPGWDFERIPVSDDHDVIVVVVDPPTGRIWPCLSDGEDLVNGDIYIRVDGETRKAHGDEVVQMMTRRPSSLSTVPNLRVDIVGEAHFVKVPMDQLERWIQQRTDTYLSQVHGSSGGMFGQLAGPILGERRSQEQFEAQVAKWSEAALGDPLSGLLELAGSVMPGIQVRISNLTKKFLRDVRLDLEIEGDVSGIEWLDPEDADLTIFPDRPLDWGKDTITIPISGSYLRDVRSPSIDGIPQIRRQNPVHISVAFAELRPSDHVATGDDDVVLISFTNDAPPEDVVIRWRITARDIHDVLEGQCLVKTTMRDWTEALKASMGDLGE